MPKDELLRRLTVRNTQEHANALLVTAAALDDFHSRFEVPDGEDEQVVGGPGPESYPSAR